VFPVNPLTGLLGFAGARSNLVPDSGLRRLIRRHITVDRLEDTLVPLHVVATDVLSGEDVRLSHGPLLEAVLASAAIPGVLPPVQWDGRLLIDGGVANNTPLSHALELGASRVYVLPTGAPCELGEAPRGVLPMALYASGLLVGRRLTLDMATIPAGVEVFVLPPPCPVPVEPIDFGRAEDLIEAGHAQAARFLDRAAEELTVGPAEQLSRRPAA
jgi:NTE family protein